MLHPLTLGYLNRQAPSVCRKCRISTCCFDGAESSDVSPFMLSQMLFQLLLQKGCVFFTL